MSTAHADLCPLDLEMFAQMFVLSRSEPGGTFNLGEAGGRRPTDLLQLQMGC